VKSLWFRASSGYFELEEKFKHIEDKLTSISRDLFESRASQNLNSQMGIELEDLNKKILELKGMHNALYNYIFEDVIDKARKTYMQKLTIEYMKRLSVTAKDLPNVHIFSQEKIIEDLCVNNKEKWKSFYNKFSVFLNSDRVELYNAINSL